VTTESIRNVRFSQQTFTTASCCGGLTAIVRESGCLSVPRRPKRPSDHLSFVGATGSRCGTGGREVEAGWRERQNTRTTEISLIYPTTPAAPPLPKHVVTRCLHLAPCCPIVPLCHAISYWPGGVSQSASASIDLNKGPHVSQSVSPIKSACERHRLTNCCCLLAHWLSTLSSQ